MPEKNWRLFYFMNWPLGVAPENDHRHLYCLALFGGLLPFMKIFMPYF
jgi:hypothetical protein